MTCHWNTRKHLSYQFKFSFVILLKELVCLSIRSTQSSS